MAKNEVKMLIVEFSIVNEVIEEAKLSRQKRNRVSLSLMLKI